MAGTEYNHVGHDDGDGGGEVGAHAVREVRQARGAGGSGVRTTGKVQLVRYGVYHIVV